MTSNSWNAPAFKMIVIRHSPAVRHKPKVSPSGLPTRICVHSKILPRLLSTSRPAKIVRPKAIFAFMILRIEVIDVILQIDKRPMQTAGRFRGCAIVHDPQLVIKPETTHEMVDLIGAVKINEFSLIVRIDFIEGVLGEYRGVGTDTALFLERHPRRIVGKGTTQSSLEPVIVIFPVGSDKPVRYILV